MKNADLAVSLPNRTTQGFPAADGCPAENLPHCSRFLSIHHGLPHQTPSLPSADSTPVDDDLVPPMTERPDESLILADSPVIYVKLCIQKVECVRPHCLQ